MSNEFPFKTHYFDLHVVMLITKALANKKRQCDKQMMKWDTKLGTHVQKSDLFRLDTHTQRFGDPCGLLVEWNQIPTYNLKV